MSISVVQQSATTVAGHQFTFGTAPPTASLPAGSTAGNWLVAVITGTAPLIAPSGWSTAVSVTAGVHAAVFYLENCAAGITSVSAPMGASGDWTIAVAEFAGVAASSSLDGTGSGTTASGSATATVAGDLLIAALAAASNQTYGSPSGSFALQSQNHFSTTLAAAWLYQVASSAGIYSAGVGSGTPDTGVVAAFKPAGGRAPAFSLVQSSPIATGVGSNAGVVPAAPSTPGNLLVWITARVPDPDPSTLDQSVCWDMGDAIGSRVVMEVGEVLNSPTQALENLSVTQGTWAGLLLEFARPSGAWTFRDRAAGLSFYVPVATPTLLITVWATADAGGWTGAAGWTFGGAASGVGGSIALGWAWQIASSSGVYTASPTGGTTPDAGFVLAYR